MGQFRAKASVPNPANGSVSDRTADQFWTRTRLVLDPHNRSVSDPRNRSVFDPRAIKDDVYLLLLIIRIETGKRICIGSALTDQFWIRETFKNQI